MFSSDRIIALDVGASGIVLAEFSLTGGSSIELLKYGRASLGVDPDSNADVSAHIIAAIEEVLLEQEIKPGPVMISISGRDVFPRYVKLPPVTGDKVLQMIAYEAEQNVPFPIDEVEWDHQLIGGTDDGLAVMLVAVKTEVVTLLTDCVIAAGCEPMVVDTAPMALFNAVVHNYRDREGCIVALDIGARSTNLVFVDDGRVFSRSIPVAGNLITNEIVKEFDVTFAEAEEMKREHAFVAFGGVYAGAENETADRISKITRAIMTRLHAEVNRSINFYRSQQGGRPPELILLCGGSSIIPHTDTFFREKLNVDVEQLNPFCEVAVADSLELERVSGDLQVLCEVVGLALRKLPGCPLEIDLMPKYLVEQKQFKNRIPFFAITSLALILALSCWWIRFSHLQSVRSDVLEETVAEIERLSGLSDSINQRNRERGVQHKKAAKLVVLINNRTFWLEIMEQLHANQLDGMWYYDLKPEMKPGSLTESLGLVVKGGVFTDKVRGSAELARFATYLEATVRHFKEVKLSRSFFGEPGVGDFILTIKFVSPDELYRERSEEEVEEEQAAITKAIDARNAELERLAPQPAKAKPLEDGAMDAAGSTNAAESVSSAAEPPVDAVSDKEGAP